MKVPCAVCFAVAVCGLACTGPGPRPTRVATVTVPSAAELAAVAPVEGRSPERATIVARTEPIAHPQYGDGVMVYPEVRVASSDATRAINDSLTKIRASVYDPTEDPQTLIAMTFRVDHNGNGVLALTLEFQANGAYPSGWAERHCYRLGTGEEVVAKTLFDPAKLDALVARLEAALQQEVGQVRRAELPGMDPACKDAALQEHFQADDLGQLQVGATGITFFHDYGLPHALLACQPPGAFPLSYSELCGFLLPDGPLDELVPACRARPEAPSRTPRCNCKPNDPLCSCL
jgi:hypothetical protein